MSQSDRSVEVSTSSSIPSAIVESSVNRWFLVAGNRWVVTGLLEAVVFVTFVTLGWSGVVGVRQEGPSTLLLSVYIAGNLTLVPIAITINQLVLSREFGKPHDLRERDRGVRQLRRDLERLAGVPVIPPTPEAFLRELTHTLDESAAAVGEEPAGTDDDEFHRRREIVVEEVAENTARLNRALDRADFGSFELLDVMLEVNSAWLVGTTEYLKHDRRESASEEPFERLEETLRLFNVTRQYVKTLYGQRELAELSRLLLYSGFLAPLVSSLGMLAYAAPSVNALSAPTRIVAFSSASTLAFLPLAFLTAYILRLSTLMSYPPLRNSFITDG